VQKRIVVAAARRFQLLAGPPDGAITPLVTVSPID
jgi:hypothetical protein